MLKSRRQFLKTLAAIGAVGPGRPGRFEPTPLPDPGNSGIEHVVVVTMENRSFDHFLGWLPGADGKQANLTFPSAAGPKSTYPLAPDYQGCSHPDPDHSWWGGRIQYDNGMCDGWLLDTDNDIYSLGYYMQQDLPFLGQAAPYWTTCDRYFAAIMAPTFPNRLYLHAGVTDRLANSLEFSSLPTIWDRLAAAGLAGRYYFTDFSYLLLWGFKYGSISTQIVNFFSDCASGSLPQVSYVDPGFNGDFSTGVTNDDHPPNDIRNGEFLLNQIYSAVTRSPVWPQTVLIITFDEWGGFFDHVPPPLAPDVDSNYRLRGFRVPCVVISPRSPRNAVAHSVYDHTSILKLIEWRWNLKPLSVRDKYANNLAEVLDFTNPPNTFAPSFAVPGPYAVSCF